MEHLFALYLILSAKGTPDVNFAVPHLTQQECKDEMKYAFDTAAKIKDLTIKGRCGDDIAQEKQEQPKQEEPEGERMPQADPEQAY